MVPGLSPHRALTLDTTNCVLYSQTSAVGQIGQRPLANH